MNIQAFTKTYQNRVVLSFPDFSFQEGMIYAVIGANGCGKSTFAKVLSGTILSDQSVSPFASDRITVGYLPQKPYVFHKSLLQNVMINAADHSSESCLRALHLLEELNLSSLSNKKAVSLSGGETARMALARIMMKDYPILILDEPCASMDISSTLQAEKLIRDYCTNTHATIFMITHSLQQAMRVSDQVLFFCDGSLLEYGETEKLLHYPDQEKTQQYLNFYRFN